MSEPGGATTVNDEVKRVVIIGTGFSGLGMAIQLKREGIHDFVVLEADVPGDDDASHLVTAQTSYQGPGRDGGDPAHDAG